MDSRIKAIKEAELGTRPSWDEYFMHIAIGVASRSSCHHVHSGTVIVSNNQILATGYNGASSRIEKNCLKTGCRKELKGLKFSESFGAGECIGIHSEMNALGHLTKTSAKKISVYTTIFPCHTCAKNILAYDIDKIIFKRFYSDKEMKSTMDLFVEAGVEVYQLDLSKERDMDMRYNIKSKFFGVWDDEKN
jgi:dCMP deaminase